MHLDKPVTEYRDISRRSTPPYRQNVAPAVGCFVLLGTAPTCSPGVRIRSWAHLWHEYCKSPAAELGTPVAWVLQVPGSRERNSAAADLAV